MSVRINVVSSGGLHLTNQLNTNETVWHIIKNRVAHKETVTISPVHLSPPFPPPHHSSSVFAGRGAFTASDASSASELKCDWVAVQKDPEGDPAPIIHNNPGRLCWWMARPTIDMAKRANELGIPFIAQAENSSEMEVALAVGDVLTVEKAIVGKPDGWTAGQFQRAEDKGWRLIAEWYWNAQPGMTAPDAGNYPYFDNVCFGIYSEGVPGGEGYVKQIPLSNYTAVWGGNYSVWKAEAMTVADRALFNAGR